MFHCTNEGPHLEIGGVIIHCLLIDRCTDYVTNIGYLVIEETAFFDIEDHAKKMTLLQFVHALVDRVDESVDLAAEFKVMLGLFFEIALYAEMEQALGKLIGTDVMINVLAVDAGTKVQTARLADRGRYNAT